MGIVPDLLQAQRVEVAPVQVHGPELDHVPQHSVSGPASNPFLHFMKHQTPGNLTASERAFAKCNPEYAKNHDFLDLSRKHNSGSYYASK